MFFFLTKSHMTFSYRFISFFEKRIFQVLFIIFEFKPFVCHFDHY